VREHYSSKSFLQLPSKVKGLHQAIPPVPLVCLSRWARNPVCIPESLDTKEIGGVLRTLSRPLPINCYWNLLPFQRAWQKYLLISGYPLISIYLQEDLPAQAKHPSQSRVHKCKLVAGRTWSWLLSQIPMKCKLLLHPTNNDLCHLLTPPWTCSCITWHHVWWGM
jgi:hypothetical protein